MFTTLRVGLILNYVNCYGRHVWHDRPEGQDVLRLFAVLSTVATESVMDALRGGAIPKETNKFVDNIFDLRLLNLVAVPTARTLRSYMGTPWRIRDVITISDAVLDAALWSFATTKRSTGHLLGATFDCVYGKSKAELVKDADGKFIVIGGATVKGLVGAALEDDDIAEGDQFNDKTVATKLMTVVLHSFHDRRDILVAILPINEETGSLIAEVFLTLRDKIYSKGSFLVFAGGDGARSNLNAWDIVEKRSNGDETTKLSDTETSSDLPFFSSGDDKEHNTKGLKRDAFGHDVWIGYDPFRLDRLLADLRGIY